MNRSRRPLLARPVLAVALIATVGSPLLAWPGDGWGGPQRRMGGYDSDPRAGDTREGHVSVDRFLAPDAGATLKQARVTVVAAPGGSGDEREGATFQAAVIDQLAKAGYDTINPDPQAGLITEVHAARDVVEPEEAKHSPVSGEMDAGVSNRGSAFGLGLNIDLTKPRKALIDTRLEITIRDRASGKSLWEGRADIITREGDGHWTDTAVAARLAGALFEHFQGPKA